MGEGNVGVGVLEDRSCRTSLSSNCALRSGKLGKSKKGWGNLPANVVCRIADYVCEAVALPSYVEENWGERRESCEMILRVYQRLWLSRLRLVSRDWQKGIEMSSFWPLYSSVINPEKVHIAIDPNPRNASSTLPHLAPFQAARRETIGVCHLCRITDPNGPATPAVQRGCWTNKFGLLPQCEEHRKYRYCINCLKDEFPYTTPESNMLRPCKSSLATVARDRGEKGLLYVRPMISCRDCRSRSLDYEIKRQMLLCARGGPMRDISQVLRNSQAARDYLSHPTCTARDAVEDIIQDLWIRRHTDYDAHMPAIRLLQALQNQVKRHYYSNLEAEPEALFTERTRVLCAELWDSPISDVEARVWGMREHTYELYTEWREDMEENELRFIEDPTSDYWLQEAFEAAIYRFGRNRIRAGVWISPEDEVLSMLGPIDTTPSLVMRFGSQLPTGVSQRSDRAYHKASLPFAAMMKGSDLASCLPPQDLLDRLDKEHRVQLQRALVQPIRIFVIGQIKAGRSFDEEPADIAEILEYIVTEPECWGPFVGHRGTAHKQPEPSQAERARSLSPLIQLVSDSSSEEEESVEGETQHGFMIRRLDEVKGSMQKEGQLHLDDTSILPANLFQELGEEYDDGDDDGDDDYDDNDWKESENDEHSSFSGDTDRVPSPLPADDLIHSPPASPLVTDAHPNGNGKRKSPPDEGEAQVSASKRRLSDDDQMVPVTTRPSDESNSKSKSRDSSASGPTETLPLTPDLSLDPPPPPHKIELQLHPTSQHRLTAFNDLPHVPHHTAKLGPTTEKMILELLQSILARYGACRCKICERGNRLQEMMEALLEERRLLAMTMGVRR